MSQAGSRFFLLRPKKCGTALLINTRHATSEGWRRKDPRWCFWKKSNARILMVRLSKTTHMWWLTQYCTASLECYSSLRTHGSRSLVLWPFTSVKHFSVNHIIGVPVDISIHHMWRTDIIHLWASWSSCFLTSDLIKFFFFNHLSYIHFIGNKFNDSAANVLNDAVCAKGVQILASRASLSGFLS